ncbi:uncharacterized protein DSM5745_00253 [Aspergillus mulundensis]|uniref:Cell wall protein n=1 Tax=Aspergillus mulundensis TaxID=1810919 RepID=A0A3D8T3A2_9EURO|nr:hypothetical protein DSM5745_00253 [Aspergillus mulundensis]RDW92931.1 hypothetical protein DSM5745_00253 [Aspergillus mulundensis]
MHTSSLSHLSLSLLAASTAIWTPSTLAAPVQEPAQALSLALAPLSMSCADLTAFNAALSTLTSLSAPPETPDSQLPELQTQLAAVSSLAAGYRDFANAFNPSNCAPGLAESARLSSRQDAPGGPGPVRLICDVVYLPGLPPILVDAVDDALGCEYEEE